MVQDYYKILDLDFGANPDEIRKAYRIKAKLCHPDTNRAPEAAANFIRLKEAFDITMKFSQSGLIRMQHLNDRYRDPYFRNSYGYKRTQTKNQARPEPEECNDRYDFLHSKAGYVLYCLMHVVFISTGFVMLLGPVLTILKRGLACYGSICYLVFSMIVTMTFGLVMIIKISGSFIKFIRKSL